MRCYRTQEWFANIGGRHTECACYFAETHMFELFDPQGELRISAGSSLPHWYQPGVTYFVTFRTEDSIPTAVAKNWRRRRDDWLLRHGVNPAALKWQDALDVLPRAQRREFHDTFSREFLEHLDRGHGACVLRRPELAQIVANSLLHFDGDRYELSDFVVMPNHAHVLVGLLGETEIEAQCYSWKKFTATKINKILGRTGRFWQEESFDHLVRSADQFEAIKQYIAANPRKAQLKPGELSTISERSRHAPRAVRSA
jgi:putative transposase